MADNLPHHTPAATPMAAVPWEGELPWRLGSVFPNLSFRSYLEQHWIECPLVYVRRLLEHLRDVECFDMLSDLTAVDWPSRAERFDVVYLLYSFSKNQRVRVKTQVAMGDEVPTATNVYPGANWLEREVFDMFGIRFSGHPRLKRILMPEDWNGFPLLKDKSIVDMDNNWVQHNLGIESGQ